MPKIKVHRKIPFYWSLQQSNYSKVVLNRAQSADFQKEELFTHLCKFFFWIVENQGQSVCRLVLNQILQKLLCLILDIWYKIMLESFTLTYTPDNFSNTFRTWMNFACWSKEPRLSLMIFNFQIWKDFFIFVIRLFSYLPRDFLCLPKVLFKFAEGFFIFAFQKILPLI